MDIIDVFKCNIFETCIIFILFCHESIEDKIKYLFDISDQDGSNSLD